MQKIEHLPLWEYKVEHSASDCDGRHYNARLFLDERWPNEMVYSEADLFAEGGPSSVRLVDESTQDSGIAYVGHATDEGGERFEITWNRVTSLKKLSEYLKAFDEGAPVDHNVIRLYKARIRALLREKFESATTISVEGIASKGPITITGVLASHQTNHRLETLWSGDGVEMPFTAEVVEQITHDLKIVDDSEFGDDHIIYL